VPGGCIGSNPPEAESRLATSHHCETSLIHGQHPCEPSTAAHPHGFPLPEAKGGQEYLGGRFTTRALRIQGVLIPADPERRAEALPSPKVSYHYAGSLDYWRFFVASYVQAPGSDTWHWCKNCTLYPSAIGDTHAGGRPSSGELCNQCLSKERDGECRD
jgi:hypothetical protein